MVRTLLVLSLAGACAFAQTANPPASQAPTPGAHAVAPQLPPQQGYNPDNVPSDAPVVVVPGVCPNGAATTAKSDSCKTVITKEQFNAMLAGMNIAAQINTPAAMRNFAETYSQLLALADAAEKAGAENDPRFKELMRVARIRALADSYRHSLEEKFSNPSQEEMEAYYKQNIVNYEAFKVERIIIPTINPNRTPTGRAEYEKKFHQLAEDIHERAARGEETQKLQDEAYKTLGLTSPPKTDLGMKRKGGLPAGIEKDLYILRPGEVTKLEPEMSGLNIYKLRSRDTIPLESVKGEIVRDLHQKNMEAAVKSVTSSVHPELNEQFFGPVGGKGGPIMRPVKPSDTLYPKGITPTTPTGGTANPQGAVTPSAPQKTAIPR